MYGHGCPGWEAHEQAIQHLLGLDSTPASGSQFYAPGDAVDNRHPRHSSFALLADAKYTEKGSFALNHHFLVEQVERATELGKRFILPLRFWPKGAYHPDDYVVSTLDDFAELVEARRTSHAHQLADIDQLVTEIEMGNPIDGMETIQDMARVIRSVLEDYKIPA
jgi:hypothetical protein